MRKRDIFILIGALLVAAALAIHVMGSAVLETANWGLSFRAEGAPPIGPASAVQLQKYDAVYLGNTAEKVIYLTFDAGYENGNTAKILDILKKHNAPGAFFLVGNFKFAPYDRLRHSQYG